MELRDHSAIILEEFNGLWQRGGHDSVPLDHFADCNNIAFIESGFETRPGIEPFVPVGDVVRMYDYKTQTNEGLLLLNSDGKIYHALLDGSNTVYGPILTIATMEDFGFLSFDGRAYITPYKTFTDGLGNKYQKGLTNEYVYVYKGDGTNARKAAGFPPSISGSPKALKAFNSQFDGVITKGIHLITVITNSLANLVRVYPVVYSPGGKQISLINIPLGAGGTTSRKILMTRAIDPKNYVANQGSYTYYEALTIADNTTTSALLSVADSGLTSVVSPASVPSYTGLTAENSSTSGFADLGFHLIAVVYETDTGYLTALGPENFASVNVIDILKAIDVKNIPVSGDTFVTKRHLVATRAIKNYNGDQTGYQFYFIPNGNIDNNTATTKTVSFYDADLLEDASHLIDNFSQIPAGVCLTTYHNRLALSTSYTDISVCYFSAQGEPEAIDQVDGIVIVPLDGLPITIGQEFRDVFYLFKKTRTWSTVDNGDVPSTWSVTIIDQGIGASVHGIASVLDSGGVNIDFLLIVDWSGIMIFNGAYARPEFTYKIRDFWMNLDRNEFHTLQIVNDSLNQLVYMCIPGTLQMLYGDYKHGMDPKAVRWTPWSFDVTPTSIALVETDVLAIASTGVPE